MLRNLGCLLDFDDIETALKDSDQDSELVMKRFTLESVCKLQLFDNNHF